MNIGAIRTKSAKADWQTDACQTKIRTEFDDALYPSAQHLPEALDVSLGNPKPKFEYLYQNQKTSDC
jgi:hypothetical protein